MTPFATRGFARLPACSFPARLLALARRLSQVCNDRRHCITLSVPLAVRQVLVKVARCPSKSTKLTNLSAIAQLLDGSVGNPSITERGTHDALSQTTDFPQEEVKRLPSI